MKKLNLDYSSIVAGLMGLVMLGLFGYGAYFLSTQVFEGDKLSILVEQAGIFAPLVLILAKSSTLIIAPLGGTLIYVVATTLFGFQKALLYTILGDLLGSAVSFWIARIWGKTLVEKFAGKKSLAVIHKLIKKIEDKRWLLAARMIGLQDFVNYAAGFMKISFMSYMGLVLITQIPLNLFFVSIATFPKQSWPARIIYIFLGIFYLIGVGLFYQKFTGKKDHITKPKGEM